MVDGMMHRKSCPCTGIAEFPLCSRGGCSAEGPGEPVDSGESVRPGCTVCEKPCCMLCERVSCECSGMNSGVQAVSPSASFAALGLGPVLLLSPRGPLLDVKVMRRELVLTGTRRITEGLGSSALNGSVGWTARTFREASLLRASRVGTRSLVSTTALPAVIRGGYNSSNNENNDDDEEDDKNNSTTTISSSNGNRTLQQQSQPYSSNSTSNNESDATLTTDIRLKRMVRLQTHRRCQNPVAFCTELSIRSTRVRPRTAVCADVYCALLDSMTP